MIGSFLSFPKPKNDLVPLQSLEAPLFTASIGASFREEPLKFTLLTGTLVFGILFLIGSFLSFPKPKNDLVPLQSLEAPLFTASIGAFTTLLALSIKPKTALNFELIQSKNDTNGFLIAPVTPLQIAPANSPIFTHPSTTIAPIFITHVRAFTTIRIGKVIAPKIEPMRLPVFVKFITIILRAEPIKEKTGFSELKSPPIAPNKPLKALLSAFTAGETLLIKPLKNPSTALFTKSNLL